MMQPLGLGSGSGLQSQSVKMDKASSSRSSIPGIRASPEPPDWGVNVRDAEGQTALHFACGMASAGTASVLLDAGADVDARNKDGYSPLHIAAGYGRHHCVKLLLEHGANVYARELSERTPRELAVKVRDDTIQTQELMKDGISVSRISDASRGDFDLIIRLLEDAESKTVDTHKSAAEESRLILQRGNVFKPLKTLQSTALGNALTVAARGDVEFVLLLLSGGAHVDFRGSDGATPLLAAADGGFANCVQLLLKSGAEANARDNIGITALIAAAYNGHDNCLRVLLKHGASINAISEGGVTPLIAAAEGRSGECTQVLLQAGAEVNTKTDGGKTALIHAVSNNCVEAAEALLSGGAEINAADGEGYTALHYGARDDSVECIRLLLERGADETRKCRLGQTPLQVSQKDSEGAKLLEASWKKLELEIARRAEELLYEDKLEHKSTASKKSTTRQVREKKSIKNKKKKKQQEIVENADHANQELTKENIATIDDIVCGPLDAVSPCSSEIALEQTSSERDSASDRSMHLVSGGSQEYLFDPFNPAPFSAGEGVFDNQDEWIRVDGKRTGAAFKTGAPQPKSPVINIISGFVPPLRGSSKSGEVSPTTDHLLTERKTPSSVQGSPKTLKDDDLKHGESSPWVQAVLGRTRSGGDGTSPSKTSLARPHTAGDGTSSQKSPPSGSRTGDVTEESLLDLVQRLELELEQVRQAERALLEKVNQLEMLKETNAVQTSELTQSSSRAQYQAEAAKADMQFRIYKLEAVVASQAEALEIAQAENADLKQQLLRREVQAAESSKVGIGGSGTGLVRSASESSLHSMGCGTESRSPLEILPFIPKAGPKTDTDNWFSLVPSPD